MNEVIHITRINTVINDEPLRQVMQGGQFQTKKVAVEEGLRLLACQETFRQILALRGKLELLDALTKKVFKTHVRSSNNKKRSESMAA